MAAAKSRLVKILDRLEKYYGKSAKPWPTDPYELVILRNSGYPQSDANCAKGFESLRKEIGIKPAQILAAPNAKLIKAIRPGVMFPEIAARRLKEIAAMVEGEFNSDLRAVLKRPLAEAKKAFKKFPTVGSPIADKILLFTKTAPVAAVPSNCVHVPLRLGFGMAGKNYAQDYRAAQEAILKEIPDDIAAQLRAYLLIKEHGQTLCKTARPRCDDCPVSSDCLYFRATRGAGAEK